MKKTGHVTVKLLTNAANASYNSASVTPKNIIL
jgi:hypothetical protein